MRFLILMLALTACGGAGSVQFVTDKDDAGVPISPKLTVAPGGQASAKVQLLAKGAEAGNAYTITVTSNDSKVTATVSPTSATPQDGLPFDIDVTVTADPTATTGTFANVFVEATAGSYVAGESIDVTVQ